MRTIPYGPAFDLHLKLRSQICCLGRNSRTRALYAEGGSLDMSIAILHVVSRAVLLCEGSSNY